LWTLVDGELFLPEAWFAADYALLRRKVGIPSTRRAFESKPELGLKMIRRVQAQGLPFEAVLCDSLYGRSSQFRLELEQAHLLYMADIPANLRIFLEQPVVGIPAPKPSKKGPKAQKAQGLNGIRSYSVQQVARASDTQWQRLRIRSGERGWLEDPFAPRRVWTWDAHWSCAASAIATIPMPSAMRRQKPPCTSWPNCSVDATSLSASFRIAKRKPAQMSFRPRNTALGSILLP
jgi:hypothetical protein